MAEAAPPVIWLAAALFGIGAVCFTVDRILVALRDYDEELWA